MSRRTNRTCSAGLPHTHANSRDTRGHTQWGWITDLYSFTGACITAAAGPVA
jgi:hypothetical protein